MQWKITGGAGSCIPPSDGFIPFERFLWPVQLALDPVVGNARRLGFIEPFLGCPRVKGQRSGSRNQKQQAAHGFSGEISNLTQSRLADSRPAATLGIPARGGAVR